MERAVEKASEAEVEREVELGCEVDRRGEFEKVSKKRISREMRRGLKFLKYLANFSICLVMIFVLSFLLVSAVLKATILNPGFGIVSLDNCNYAARSAADMQKSLVNLGQPSGIPEKALLNTVSSVQLRKALSKYVVGMSTFLKSDEVEFKGSIDSVAFEDMLTKAIQEYAVGQKIKLDDATNRGISQFVAESARIYKNSLNINRILIMQAKKMVKPFVGNAMFLVFVVLVALQLLINRSVTKAMQWSGISFAVAGGLALTVSLLCITLKISERLNIEPDYFRDFFDTIISGMATSAAVAGLAMLAAGVLFVVAYATAKKKRRA